MGDNTTTRPGINSWFEDELQHQFRHDRTAVDEDWKQRFLAEGETTVDVPSVRRQAPPAIREEVKPPSGVRPDQLVPLRGVAARIATNMNASLSLPVATSQRTVPVKVMEENRRIINQHRAVLGKTKVSFTHLIAYALVRAIEEFPSLNHAYHEDDSEAFRILRQEVNLGIAIDLAGKDGERTLLVPNIKDAQSLDFQSFLDSFDDLIGRARSGKLAVQDFQNTTISLTNPGTVGTVASMPRLMPGQGAIIATGVIDFPAEFQGASASMRAALGVSKVMTLTCTYDHRIIQGAESGMFLGRLEALLQGEDGFYERIFAHLKMPHQPVKWEPDRTVAAPGISGRTAETAKEAAVLQLINAYRVRGHLIADLDPLGSEPQYHPEMDPANYGLTIWDLDREFLTGTLGRHGDGAPLGVATLRRILETLRRTYCGKIGCEYMNIQHPEQKRWLQERMEPQANSWPLEGSARVRVLDRLLASEEFEHFLHTRFVGQKRFSLEGAETAMAILHELLERSAEMNVHEMVIGMAHRGRLNVLGNLIGKPFAQIFSEFEGDLDPGSMQGSGDVKYHLGASGVYRSATNREIVVSLAPNPSHLEAVDPVVQGIVRPKQERLSDNLRERVIPVLIHGDAAFAGQGVVAETLNLSQLEGYHTGGTIHIIINNQIGFTTSSDEARSTPYSTDVARMVQAPIFHVNGDDPESAVRAAQIALDYRQQFKKDVVIDMFCYRRHGHNEADDPSYTQPVLYRRIREHPLVADLYAERLVREGVIEAGYNAKMRSRFKARLEEGFQEAQRSGEGFEVQELAAMDAESVATYCPRTAIDAGLLDKIIEGLTTFPSDFRLHPKLKAFVSRRREVLEDGAADWALGEALAFGSLVLEGTPVRLSGQDSGRGTFSQRHLRLHDSETGEPWLPMQHLSPGQARFQVWDSSLSEYAVLGFEFGYSVADPLTLVIWEAQFGDFANGAQIMIDQFITTAEQKWGQPSGLVMLLPHGYEGQGPEHSSARIERFLALCAEENIQVTNLTTPAQYFHVLRRQMYGGPDRRGVRKPLVIFTPKSLLRHPQVVSSREEFLTGGFQEVLTDAGAMAADRIGRVLLCTGKIYYELAAAREERGARNVAILRLEQIYPFPAAQLRDVILRYAPTCEVVWVQEEPRNMGPWRFVRERLQPVLDPTRRVLRYAGRPESASPATGSYKRHQQEQADVIEEAFSTGEFVRRRRVRVPVKRPAK